MKPTLTLLITLAALTASAQELDTICFTRPQYEAMATDLQRADYTKEVVLPSLRYIINNQSDTITKQAIKIMDLERVNTELNQPCNRFWHTSLGVITGTLIGAILWGL